MVLPITCGTRWLVLFPNDGTTDLLIEAILFY